MPVPWDRFVRVVSGGKYGNTQDLFAVRRDKVNTALQEIDRLLVPFNPPAVAPNTFPELDGIRQEVVDYRATVQTALGLANADLRKATELLDPLKDQARATKERAQKMTARVEKLREVDLNYGTAEYQDDEQHQTTMKPFEDWDRTYPRAGQALVDMPTGAGALFDHIKVLDLYIVQLPLIAARVIAVGTNQGTNANVPAKIAEKYQKYPRIQTECNDLVHSLTDRRNYLQGMLDKTPLTEQQVYRSKAESVKAAIRQVNALVAAGPPNLVALQAVVLDLTARSTTMTNNNSNKPVPNLDKVLGKKGGKPSRYRDLLTANGAAAIATFPIVTPDCREDSIMEAVVEWCTRGAYPNLTEEQAKKRAKHGYHNAQIKELNEGKVWGQPPIRRAVQLEGKDGKPVKLESEIIPAAQLGNKFTAQMNGHGVSSHDTTAYHTTKNLAATELRNKDGEVIFKGLRHGINCAYGITPNKIKEMTDAELETMVNDLCVDERPTEVRQRATLRRAIAAQANNANPALQDLATTGTSPNFGIDAATVKALGFTPAKVMQMNDRERRKFLDKALAHARDDEAEARAGLRARLTLLNQQNNAQGKAALLAELKNNGKVDGVSVGALRRKANVNRSMDIVVAALVRNPDKLRAALAQPNKAVTISINSMSLVTPDAFRRGEDGNEDEAKMLREQMAAWEKVSADPQPRKIWVDDANHQQVEVTVRIEVLAFNFGVNAGAVAYGKAPGSGWGTSNGYNQKAMDQLLGKKSERQKKLGGRVGRWLGEERESLVGMQSRVKDAMATLKQKSTELERIPKNTQVLLEQQRRALLKNEIEDLKRDLRPMEEDFKKRVKNFNIVEKLAKQIAAIWDSSSYESQGNEPYKIVSRLAVLTHKMGDDPAFNCKSGKDRTGQLDVEAKLLASQIEEDGDVPEPDHKPSELEKRNRYNGALNFGNHEMQELNTGHMGFKLKGVKSLDKSLPDKEGVKAYRGTSDQTKS